MMDSARSVDLLYDWSPEKMVEVRLEKPDDFLKIRETLTRIGISSKRQTEGKYSLTQTCHLLHKKGRYYIVHFKEMFALDGRESNLSVSDVERRNLIVGLLASWGLLTVVHDGSVRVMAPMSSVHVIPYKEKENWILVSKYTIGKKEFTRKP